MRIGVELCVPLEGSPPIAAVLQMGTSRWRAPHQRLAEQPGWTEWGVGKFCVLGRHVVRDGRGVLSTPDRMDLLASLPMPTLVVVGEQDRAFRAVSARMAEVISDARLSVIPMPVTAPSSRTRRPGGNGAAFWR